MNTAHEHQLDIFPELMTENELVEFLRIPVVSQVEDYGNVIANLKRMEDFFVGRSSEQRRAVHQKHRMATEQWLKLLTTC